MTSAKTIAYPRLHFREPFGGDDATGDCQQLVTVEVEDGRCYPVCFYDPGGLTNDLQHKVEKSERDPTKSFIAPVGLIVVPRITEANMRIAIKELYESGWLDNFKPTAEI